MLANPNPQTMSQAYFITGTDTEIGKTHATCALLATAANQGLRSVALKPVAAGTDATGRNDDVVRLMAASNVALHERTVNPWLLTEPLSPHIAARHAGVEITAAAIIETFHLADERADFLLVEGVGGLYAPLSETLTQPELIRQLDIPVILVVGLRLGCLNHALLTAAAIEQEGLRFAGWIGNRIDPAFQAPTENIQTLNERLKAPCLGTLPYDPLASPNALASYLSLPR
jgi:dethiobiotin synthetase